MVVAPRVTPLHLVVSLLLADTGRPFWLGGCVCVCVSSKAFSKQKCSKWLSETLVDSNHNLYKIFTLQTLWHKPLTSVNPPSYWRGYFFVFTSWTLHIHKISHTLVIYVKCHYHNKVVWSDIRRSIQDVKQYSCNISFIISRVLSVHRRIHTGEKHYSWDFCEKAFRTSSDFVVHKGIHKGRRLYSCNACEKAFCSSGELTVHKRII